MTVPPLVPLRRNRDFLAFLTAQTASVTGTQVTALALPTLAILSFHAGPAELGLLTALPWLPLPILGPFAGLVIDRLRRRSIMIAADLARAAVLLSVPVLYGLGVHSLLHLYLVAFAVGVLSVFFDVSYLSYLPSLVHRDQLPDGNGLLAQSEGAAQVVGPSLGGALIGVLGAASTVSVDAASYLLSALSLSTIRRREVMISATSRDERGGIWGEMREGATVLIRHPVVRILMSVAALQNLGSTIVEAVVLILAYRQAHLTPALIGITRTIGSVTFLITALFAARLTRVLGVGRTLGLSSLVGGVAYFAIPLSLLGAPAVCFAFWAVLYGLHLPTWNVNVLTVRQTLIPARLQGRVTAVSRSIGVGTAGIGPLLGGVLGSTVGLTPTVAIGGGVFLLGSLPILARPIRRLHEYRSLIPSHAEGRSACDTIAAP